MYDQPQHPINQTSTTHTAKELTPEEIGKLFELETLSPPGEANGMSCCVILCWVKL